MKLEYLPIPFIRVLLISGLIATLKPETRISFFGIFIFFIVFEWINYSELKEERKVGGKRRVD